MGGLGLGLGVGLGDAPQSSAPGGALVNRFYLPSSGAAAASPAPDAAWAGVTGNSLALVSAKTGTVAGDLTGINTGIENVLCVQYVSAPLATQTLAGTVKGQMWCRESLSTMDSCSQVVIRVVSGDGSVVRGTLLAAHAEALSSEWGAGAGARSRKFPLAALSPATLTPVEVLDGDRLVIELGGRVTAAVVGELRVRARDNQAGDLPEDETTNDTADPWIEFLSGVLLA